MDPEVIARIAQLGRGEDQPIEFFLDTYGLNEAGFRALEASIDVWSKRVARQNFTRGTAYSRWIYERFLSTRNLVAPRRAANKLGMDMPSLNRVLAHAISAWGIPQQSAGLEGVFFQRDFIENIHQNFEHLQYMLFGDHTTYCRAVHEGLRSENVDVGPQYDEVARVLSPKDVDLCESFDIVTLRPIGLRFNVWLTFGKPFALAPDLVSASTFLKYRVHLEQFVPDYSPVDEGFLEELAKHV